MLFKDINRVHFIGIGGIGMSALARYFNQFGKRVSGYDKTATRLTQQLIDEGIDVYFKDKGSTVLDQFDPADTLIIYTPAIPIQMQELKVLQESGFKVIKRAKALGLISSEFETYAVAGTHGKTTTSAILAHVLYQSKQKCNAFIGGISCNYNSNCLIDQNSNRVVVEADEFDRSFLQLKPNYSIVTTVDADHLDIYGDGDALLESFNDFINLTNINGHIFIQAGINTSRFELKSGLLVSTYGFNLEADWQGENLRYEDGHFYFDIYHKGELFEKVEFGLPGKHNAENALAVFGLAYQNGLSEDEIRAAFKSFKGVKRRFDFHIRTNELVIIDDYAHHPTEIRAFLSSIKEIYPNKKITTVFQPHLYSRTRDFMDDFAEVLGLSDQLYLLDIYPAREEPISGITSEVLLEKVAVNNKYKSTKSAIVQDLKNAEHEIIVIVGAGDIDTCIQPIVNAYKIEGN